MYKLLTKYSILTLSLFGLFFISSPKVEASLSMGNDFNIDPNNIVLSFADASNGISSFVIKNLPKEVGTSQDIEFNFEYYNMQNDEIFKISIPQNGAISTSYGSDYNVDETRDIRILPSRVNYEMSYNNTIAKLSFLIKYHPTRKNQIQLLDSTYYPPGDNFSFLQQSINIDLKMVIPLKLSDENLRESKVGTKNGILSEGSYNSGKEIVDEVIAEIKITPSGIIFDNGLDKTISDNTDLNETKNNTNQENISTLDNKGFAGHGILPPKKNTYKGVSTVTDFNEFIIGIANFVLTFVAVICVLILIYGGYLWIIDRGEEQLAEKARKILAGAIIGLLIIISAYTIVNTIISLDSNNDSSIDINVNLNK